MKPVLLVLLLIASLAGCTDRSGEDAGENVEPRDRGGPTDTRPSSPQEPPSHDTGPEEGGAGSTFYVLDVRGLVWSEPSSLIGLHCDMMWTFELRPDEEVVVWNHDEPLVTEETRALVAFHGSFPSPEDSSCPREVWLETLATDATELRVDVAPLALSYALDLSGDTILLDGAPFEPGDSRTFVVDETAGNRTYGGYLFVDHRGAWPLANVVRGDLTSDGRVESCPYILFTPRAEWWFREPSKLWVDLEFGNTGRDNVTLAGTRDGARVWVEVRDPETRELVATTVGDPLGFGAKGPPATLGARHQNGWGNETAVLQARAELDLDRTLEGGRTYEVLVHYATIEEGTPGCRAHFLSRATIETWTPS